VPAQGKRYDQGDMDCLGNVERIIVICELTRNVLARYGIFKKNTFQFFCVNYLTACIEVVDRLYP
jgi:hypothetical protein